MKNPAISIQNLTKKYGDLTAVDNLSLEIKEGEFFGFLGPNGAGKTTTINSIVGLVNFQQGNIKVFGHDVIKEFRQSRTSIGLAPQEFNFDRYLTVKEILVYQAGYYGIRKKDCWPRADELLKQFGIYNKRNDTISKLSGGMKRRLTLARALVHDPKLLILDEPTAGMDVELRIEMWEYLKKANRKGLTIFLTTHYLEEAEQLCGRIGIINAGRLVKLADKSKLMKEGKLQDIFLRLTKSRQADGYG
ncbi:ABC transporter ATP-binding protein [Candidatus Woesearchaeota archaeon]|nr:ABC transporter ATP-binding protein [Candidatus Woesearchaeota archaeon]